jgi:hypothetical protein
MNTATFTPSAIDFNAINVHDLRKMAPEWNITGARKLSVSDLRGLFIAEQGKRNAAALEAAKAPKAVKEPKVKAIKEPKVKAIKEPKAVSADTLHRPAKGEKAAWDNTTKRLEGEAKATAIATISATLLTGDGLFTADFATILGMKEGSVYGRLKTQEANGRIVGTLVNPLTKERGAGARGEHGLKLIWQVAGATPESVALFANSICK